VSRIDGPCNDPRSASTKIGYGRLRPGRMQLAHVTSDTHDAGACIDGLRDEQAPHPLHMVGSDDSDGSDGSGGSGGYTLLYAKFLAYLRSGTFPSVPIASHQLRSCIAAPV
jgi:hypothetical protein